MIRLALLFQGIIGSTIASVFVVGALVAGVTGLWPLLGLAALGLALGFPVALIIAKRMMDD
ncbi:CTP synthetase [Aliiroseovarius subalbicans]|uniref:CTP synthetase n=1 Tax=Aliiroseovarius subalbicans TaxID=2925840 RepID=UPI001F566681|nr:CTP synthetase [Aliiroseovarius subalbicans]MCI2400403.1 CTP synthetase [Aliiroseovarius subalbicans]